MGVIKVETFDVSITNDLDTYTLSNDVGDLADAFVRKIGPTDKGSGGPTGSTGNTNPNVLGLGAALTATDEITFYKNTSTQVRQMGEVWRYTGVLGGADEFIVRGRYAVTVTGTSATQALSGIVNRNNCVPIFNGWESASATVNYYDVSTLACHINSSGDLIVSRGATGTAITAYVTIVEFTGSNWSVGHAISSSHDASTETVTLNTDSTGAGGSVVDVGSWNKAMIIDSSMEGDSAGETGIGDIELQVYPAAATDSVTVSLIENDSGARNDGDAYVHVIVNQSLIVNRTLNTNVAEGNGATGTVSFPSGSSSSELIEDLSLEWYIGTSGTGTAHGRGRLTARITAGTGTITHWVHRSGNTVRLNYGVIELNGLDNTANISVSDVDGDEAVGNIQANVAVTGAPFGAVQNTGKVELVQNSNYTGTIVLLAVNSWSDSLINVDISAGALADTNCFLFVTSDSGARGFLPVTVGVPPLTYEDVIDLLSPDHYWTFNNNYVDSGVVGGSNAANNQGTPTFTTNPITIGSTHSLTISAQGQRVEAPDNNEMNLQAETTRTMGGWINITQIQDSFVCFYEEGGGVNNLAFFMGMGGILIAQLADTNDDNVHAYSDFKLEPDRNYHICFRFDYTGTDRFELLVDGVVQGSTFGNPLTATDLDAHSGDIGWGDAEGTLEVFGTDITFPAAVTSYYNDWASWTVFLTDATIREQLFERGVVGEIIISTGTEAEMQTALDVYAGTVQVNSDCTFVIEGCSDGDFTLEFDNISFNESTSIQFQYRGIDVLTANNINGSNLVESKISTPNFGTVNIVTPSSLMVTGLQANTEVRVFNAGTETEVAGIESVTGTWITSIQSILVDLSVMSLGYKMQKLKGIDTSSDRLIPINQSVDRQYENPL